MYDAGPRTSTSSPEHDQVDCPKEFTRLDRLRDENKSELTDAQSSRLGGWGQWSGRLSRPAGVESRGEQKAGDVSMLEPRDGRKLRDLTGT